MTGECMQGGEFEIIDEFFAPLAKNSPGAANLKDDAAILSAGEYVVSKDILVEGVHFRSKDGLDTVARKLLRVNLSDLAAKGARPVGYFLGCVWRAKTTRKDIAAFVDGLEIDQDTYQITLFGGDTTMHNQTDAPNVFSATIFGAPPRHGVVRRSGAELGDDVYVSGSIGDGCLGLKALNNDASFSRAHQSFLVERYQTPTPRIVLGSAVAGFASATIDVSDGLAADGERIADASGPNKKIVLRAGDLPLSDVARSWVNAQSDKNTALAELATHGDDYEILFTAPPSRRRSVEMAANVSKTPVTRIGTIAQGEGVSLLAEDGTPIRLASKGHDHFARK